MGGGGRLASFPQHFAMGETANLGQKNQCSERNVCLDPDTEIFVSDRIQAKIKNTDNNQNCAGNSFLLYCTETTVECSFFKVMAVD